MSRERFGKEFEGMLKKSLPRGLKLLHDMQILPLLLTEDPAATAAAASADAEAAATAATAAATDGTTTTTTTTTPAVVRAAGPSEEAWSSMLEVSAWLEEAMKNDGIPFMMEAGTEAAAATNNTQGGGGGGSKGGGSPKAAQKSGKGSPASSPTEKARADNNEDATSESAAAMAPEAVRLQRRRSALLASAVLPFQGRTSTVGKKKFMPGAQAALQEGLKTTLKDAEQSAALVEAVPQLRALAARLSNYSPSAASSSSDGSSTSQGALRLEVGLLLTSLKALWRPALALALASELQATLGPCPLPMSAAEAAAVEGAQRPMDGAGAKDVAARFEAVASTVQDLNLDGCWSVKPLLNGKELGALLELPLGPKVGDAMREQALWQLEHPDGTKDECLAALKTRNGQ